MLEEEYQQRRRLPPHLKPLAPPEPAFEYSIREAELADLPHVRAIYNHYVMNSTVTFDEVSMTLPQMRKKFEKVRALHMPFIIAESPRGEILGYAYVTPWKEKAAYRFTVENSVYLGPASTSKGLGTEMMRQLLERSKAAGVKEVVAVIADKGADASIRLHERFGFKRIGHMGRVGFKFDRWLGTILMQKSLK